MVIGRCLHFCCVSLHANPLAFIADRDPVKYELELVLDVDDSMRADSVPYLRPVISRFEVVWSYLRYCYLQLLLLAIGMTRISTLLH